MSCEPHFTSPTRPAFRRHRHCASSTDSYYSCDNTTHYQLTRTQSPLSTTNQLPSSFAYRPPYLPSHILSNEQFNSSQSSLGQSSNYHSSTSHTRYPEPYTDNPFLPLQALRHLRSNEQLVKSPSFQSLASATLSRRKPPPSLVLKDINPAPLAASNCQVNAPQGHIPEVERRPATRPIVLSDSSQFSHANSNSGESDLASAYTCHTSLPIELYPANLPRNNHHVGTQSTRIPVIESSRTKSITESRTVDVPDTGLMLRFRSGVDIQVSENEGRRWSINEVPGDNEVNEFAQDIQEQNVAYGGMSESGPIGKTNLDTAKSQIHADPDKTPTNELEGIPWPSVHASTPALPRKRPPPIYVGNQVQRSTLTQTEMTAAARSNAENAPLKLDSPTSINSDGFASPRKLSDASHFSLSMFPPTPTTPNYGDIVRAGLNSANSPLRQTFSPTRESLSAPPVGFAPPFSPRSLQPPSPPHHHRSAPNTPVRRSTAEADHGSFLSYTQNRTKRASTDSPTQHQKKAQSIANHHLPAISPKPDQPSPRVAQPFPDRERTNTLASLGSDSVYSQDQDSDSGSCYSDDDDAASMTSSVAEAIMMAQEERRFSRQSRLAYMRDVAMSESAQEPSVESHASLSSDPDSSEQSASPVTPDDDEIGGYPEEKAAIPLVRLERPSEAPPTVNIIPPNRKAAPRMSTVSGSTLGNLPRITPEPELKPLRPSPSMFSIRSRSTPMSRVPGKIVISHPHMNAENALGAEVLPQGADIGASRVTLTTDGGVGVHSLAHSRSMPALRVPGSSTLNVREKKQKEPKPPFDKYGMPSVEQLSLASEMSVYDEYGRPVRFGDIFESQKTAVCFIRHFYCPLCQDYMTSIVRLTEPAFVEKAGVKLVIIGNGSPSMIKAYRDNIFHCPYEMYTDPSRQVYNALGMNLRTTDGGSEEERGSYVKHGTFTGTMMVLKNALKMPLANAGDIKQLGGEFILGPGLTCSFTSRMHTTRSHTPIRDLLQAAGVDTNPWATDLSFLQSETDQARWMDVQNEDLDRLIRRGLQAGCNEQYCALDDDVNGAGEMDLGEFRRLLERLKGEEPTSVPTHELESEPKPEPKLESALKPVRPAPVITGSSYEIEVKGQRRVELDHLGAVLQSRNGSSTWEACRDRKRSTSSRPGTANSRPGTATSRPGTARSTVSFGRV